MKKILRRLYCNPEADLRRCKDEHVEHALKVLNERLTTEMKNTYRWLAACTVAVEAGRWGGERRRKRRVKLLAMVNACRTRLGQGALVMEDPRWALRGLHYGYGAYFSAAEAEAQLLSLVHEDQR